MMPISARAYGADLRATLPLIGITLSSAKQATAPLRQPVRRKYQYPVREPGPFADESFGGGSLVFHLEPALWPFFDGFVAVRASMSFCTRTVMTILPVAINLAQ